MHSYGLAVVVEGAVLTFRYLDTASDFVDDIGGDWNGMTNRDEIGWPGGLTEAMKKNRIEDGRLFNGLEA